MASIDGALLDFRRMDRLAAGDTALHRLDPRAKVLVTLVFIGTVVSFGKYAVTGMIPLVIFPVVMVSLGNLPPGYIAKKIALLCPFALVVGMFNPLFDRTVLVHLGPIDITGGWVSFTSIIIRAILTVGAALILVGVTGFPAICQALERLGVPQLFAVQLLFLYRYIFVLTEEGARASRARELRSFGKKGLGMASFGSLVGHLLLRTWAPGGTHPHGHAGAGVQRRISCPPGIPLRRQGTALPLWLVCPVHHAASLEPASPSGDARNGNRPMSHHIVEVKNLRHIYPDGTAALRDVSFRITHGESVAIIGANGAGKSTLLLHLNGSLAATGGEIRIGDFPLTKGTLPEIRRTVGMVFQDPDDQLFMPTVYDDVAFGPLNLGLPVAEVEQRVRDALDRVGAGHLRDKPPYHLSGGEKKRVAIATVLSMSPDILVMDEPTSGLDPFARRQLMGCSGSSATPGFSPAMTSTWFSISASGPSCSTRVRSGPMARPAKCS